MWRAARPMVWISDALGAQEPLLVGVEDRDQRHLGNVEALAQQVDAHQHVELAQSQVADDLHPLDRVDVGVQVADLDAVLVEVVGEVLGHPLGQRGDQHALAAARRAGDLGQQVVDLRLRRAHVEHGVDQARRPHQLLDHLPRVLLLVVAPASPTRRSSAAGASRTRRSAAAGCRAPRAGGTRS